MTQSEVADDIICRHEAQSSATVEDADLFLRRVHNWMRMGRDLSRISRSLFDKADAPGLGHIPAESIEARVVENVQGLDGWTASMTAAIVIELRSRLLTSPSSDKVWEDDWEVAFRKLVQRCQNNSNGANYSSAEPSWTLQRNAEPMQNQHQGMPHDAYEGHPCSQQSPAMQKSRAAKRRQSLPVMLPSQSPTTPCARPASRIRAPRMSTSAVALPKIQESAAAPMRSHQRRSSLTDNLERFPRVSAAPSVCPSSRRGSATGSASVSHQVGPSSDHARRMAAVRALDANTRLWQAKSPAPKANASNAGRPKMRKPVRTSQTFGGPISIGHQTSQAIGAPGHQTSQAAQSAPTSPNVGNKDNSRAAADRGSLTRIGRAKSEELKSQGKKVSIVEDKSQRPAKSKSKWRSAFIKLKAIHGFADAFGVDVLRDAAQEWEVNRRQNRAEAPKQVFLKLAEKGENRTRKHKLLRMKSAKALREVFQGISLTDDNDYITVHDFIRHVKASAPKLVDQATKMFDKLHNMTENDSHAIEGAVDFSKLLRCLWPGLSDDQVKDIVSMARAPKQAALTKKSITKNLNTVKEIFDVLNCSKSGFLTREEALEGIDNGQLVVELQELSYLFGPPNTSYAKSHVHFEEFFAWWCSDHHAAIKDYIDDGQQQQSAFPTGLFN